MVTSPLYHGRALPSTAMSPFRARRHTNINMKICDMISPAEWDALRDDAIPGISRYNRATLLRMLAEDPQLDDEAGAEVLRAALQDYLNRYMPDRPEAHKWVILPCLYLAFAAREPMHPREIVGWQRVDGVYRCPARDEAGICRWCVCQ